MTSVKLGTKIGVGFGALILLALILGGVAVWNIGAVRSTAEMLSRVYLPQVKLASEQERNFQQVVLGDTVYAYTQDRKFLDSGQKALAQVRKNLKDSEKLATQFSKVSKFGDETKQTAAMINRFEKEVNEAAVKDADLLRNYAQVKETGKFFLDTATQFLSYEINGLKTVGSTGQDPGKVSERLEKLALASKVLQLGNRILLSAWDAQTERNLTSLDLQKTFESLDKDIDSLKTMTHSDDGLSSVQGLQAASSLYKSALSDLVDVWSGVQQLDRQREKTERQIIELSRNVHDAGVENVRKASDHTVSKVSFYTMFMVLGILFSVVAGLSIAIFITRAVTKPIREVVTGLMEGADKVSSASSQVASSSQSVAEGASRQSQALQTSTASLDQIGSATRHNASNALQANQLMQNTSGLIQLASQSMVQLTSAMTDITSANQDTQKIISTIDSVAFQTRLLALNAAVEAARAGEAGAGFAVVADEVKNLATRTAGAARETADIIEHTTQRVKDGYNLAVKTDEEFSEVARTVASCRELVEEISQASQEQSLGIDMVNKSVAEMHEIVEANAADSEESAAASQEMNAQAEQMKGFVTRLVSLVGVGGKKKNEKKAPHSRRFAWIPILSHDRG